MNSSEKGFFVDFSMMSNAIEDQMRVVAAMFAVPTVSLGKSISQILIEAVEEQQRQIAAMFAAQDKMLEAFQDIGDFVRRQSEPGTFLGDLWIVWDENGDPETRENALMRLVKRLRRYPIEPEAKIALRRLGNQALVQLLPKAVLLAIRRMDDEQTYRPGKKWLTDEHGREMVFRPSEYYAPSQEHQIIAYLRKEVRNFVEKELIDLGREIEVDASKRLRDTNLEDDLADLALFPQIRSTRSTKHCKVCDWAGRLSSKKRACPKCGLPGSVENEPLITVTSPHSVSLPSNPSLEDLAIDREASIHNIMRDAKLSKRERQIIELTIDGLEPREIAQMLGMKVGALSTAKHRAIEKMFTVAKRAARPM